MPIDPIGFGLEKFDAIGQNREKLKVTFFPGHGEKAEKPTTAEHRGIWTPADFAAASRTRNSPRRANWTWSGAQPQCQECVVKQLFATKPAAGRRGTDRGDPQTAIQDFGLPDTDSRN